MQKLLFLVVTVISIYSCAEQKTDPDTASEVQRPNEVQFYTQDSIKIFGDLFELDKSSSIVLLFHQGGANAKGEYTSIIPELTSLGYNVLSIDQRLGGQLFGHYNRTVANIAYKDFSFNGYSYCDAYPDLEGALKFVNDSGFTGDKILWGSSYSATLSIKLAGAHSDEVKGVLAFSPASGNPMKNCQPDQYFDSLKDVPLLILKPTSEMQSENSIKQIELAKQLGHETFIAQNGVHGSSMLVKERVNNNVDENWKIVKGFLEKLKK
ncbi:MAG: hypothetical protein QNJ57_03135 [Flavobacteriaceae bacterium]|nr:hypothetical protein [Flavobacteriaceae bacterium]